jgi:hypothetical protein
VIKSANLAALPAEGQRVSPKDAANMPTLATANSEPVLSADVGAHHYRLVGLHFMPQNGVATVDLVTLGLGSATNLADQPHHVVIERSLFQGDPLLGLNRGIKMNSAWTAVLDSYFSDIKATPGESNAIAAWNGPGPFLIHNNRLEAAYKNLSFGGDDPGIAGLIAQDVSICQNLITRNLAWRKGDPSYDGSDWKLNSPVMLHSVKRVLISGNVIENTWDSGGYHSFGIYLSPANSTGKFPQATIEDATIAFNVERKVTGAIWVDNSGNGNPTAGVHRVRVHDNLIYDIGLSPLGGIGGFIEYGAGPDSMAVTHNTVLVPYRYSEFDTATVLEQFGMRDNILGPAIYGFIGSGTGEGVPTLTTYTKAYVFDFNVLTGRSCTAYPANNFCPADLFAVGFIDAANHDYHLAASSTYATAASDGGPIGAHIDQVLAATAGMAP